MAVPKMLLEKGVSLLFTSQASSSFFRNLLSYEDFNSGEANSHRAQ
jgi:hypothetical protein